MLKHNMNRKNKKAQITMFIIIGLVIFMAFLFVLYFQQRVIKEPAITAPLERVAEEVPLEVLPIKQYTQECLDKTLPEAIIQVGLHGGYSDPENPQSTGIDFNLDPGSPTESDGVYLDQIPVIYWYHMDSPNKCTSCTISIENMPSLSDILTQIENYVKTHTDDCLENFTAFREQGFEVKQGEMTIQTQFFEETVRMLIDFPVTIEKEGRSTVVSKFFSISEVNIVPMYILANSMVIMELESLYLEQILMNLITAYSGVTPDKLPPISYMEKKEYYSIWTKDMAGEQLKQVLRANIPLMQVDKTKGAHKIVVQGDPIATGFYDTLYLESDMLNNMTKDNVTIEGKVMNFSDIFKDIKVKFHYFDWPLHFDVTPSEGEVLRPSVITSSFPFDIIRPYRINYYDFFYDVSYPVIVELRDENALGGKGFSLMFAMEGTIIDNKNLMQWNKGDGTFGPVDYTKVVSKIESPPDSLVRNQTKSMMCYKNQRIGKELILRTKDASDDQPLGNVSVFFGCGDYDTCDMGGSKYDATTNISELRVNLPIGMGCFLRLEKPGYEKRFIGEVDSAIRQDEDPYLVKTIEMEPLKEMEINVKQRNINSINTLDDLAGEDTVILTVRRLPTDEFLEFSQTFLFNSERVPDLPDDVIGATIPNIIKLIPGEYEVTAQIINQEGAKIEQCAEHLCEGPLNTCLWVDECIPDKDLEIKPLPIGGLALNSRTGIWEVDREMLKDPFNNVTFTVLRMQKPSTLAEMQDLAQTERVISINRDKFEPEFS